MDRITKQLVKDFLQTQEKPESNSFDDFEIFSNFSVVSNEYNKTFEPENITVGNGDDTGIDGIAIIVNGHLVESQDEVDDLLESNGYLEVTYVFVQSKTSSNFDTKEMHNFYFGVKDFFSESPMLRRNSDITNFAELSNYILDLASSFRENPKCKLFYITTGVYNPEDSNIEAVRSNSISELSNYNLFEKITSELLGANEIGKLYRKTKSPSTATFVFTNKVTLKDIEHINQSYYGVLPFSEFRKIIIDDNDNVKSVFDDNVRDFQGVNNPVNKNIAETLTSNNSELFSVLNNGVTIVASKIKSSGNNMTIYDYQIVNGCQTSNVLYECRNSFGINNTEVPIRLIVTENEDVKGRITVSTNNQTTIKKDQLSAMTDFQKNLELYYNSVEGDGRLYYERRAKQYNSDRSVVKRRIITVSNQIKSFSAMFHKNPHYVTSYYGNIVKKLGEDGSSIFEAKHQYAPYYLAGLAFYRLEMLFNSGLIDRKYKKIKFFILMLFLELATKDKLKQFDSKKLAEKYCNPIIKDLNNNSKTEKLFISAIKIVEESEIDTEDKQLIKSKTMTEKLLEQSSKQLNEA